VSAVAWTAEGRPAYETEGLDLYPEIHTSKSSVPIPQPEKYGDLRAETVRWRGRDRTPLEGMLYEAKGTEDRAPLLVLAHGGPAGTVEARRSTAVRHRHLLRAGYRVFEPAFRGSLGFGDAFAGGNIACQGEDDLEDIVSGIDYLVRAKRAQRRKVGIFGGSYGGYMALRAMAVTDRFAAGVALFGFVFNRWMTLETGDFTYEEEYIAPVRWPLTDRARRGDVFLHIHTIQSPLLMLHGEEDPICSVSQSVITCRALERLGVATGLVIYPGEGHGFRKEKHRRDSARRTLGWFLEHLPPE
jgi:dipeptidyl aminopeptidase/acylaminoacyl peptidase